MKVLAYILVVVAVISFILGLVSRVTLKPFVFGLVAHSFLDFTKTCLLFAITLLLLQKK